MVRSLDSYDRTDPDDRMFWHCRVNDRTPQSANYRKPYRKPTGRKRSFVHGKQTRYRAPRLMSIEEMNGEVALLEQILAQMGED